MKSCAKAIKSRWSKSSRWKNHPRPLHIGDRRNVTAGNRFFDGRRLCAPLKKIGHTVARRRHRSLRPIAIRDTWVKKCAGIKLSDIKIMYFQNDKKQNIAKGKILFTHVGASRPTILDEQRYRRTPEIRERRPLDLFPSKDNGALDVMLRKNLFKTNDKKKFQNALRDIIPSASTAIGISRASTKKTMQQHYPRRTREARQIIKKHTSPRAQKNPLRGAEKAIITSGGVALDEVDFSTRLPRLFPEPLSRRRPFEHRPAIGRSTSSSAGQRDTSRHCCG